MSNFKTGNVRSRRRSLGLAIAVLSMSSMPVEVHGLAGGFGKPAPKAKKAKGGGKRKANGKASFDPSLDRPELRNARRATAPPGAAAEMKYSVGSVAAAGPAAAGGSDDLLSSLLGDLSSRAPPPKHVTAVNSLLAAADDEPAADANADANAADDGDDYSVFPALEPRVAGTLEKAAPEDEFPEQMGAALPAHILGHLAYVHGFPHFDGADGDNDGADDGGGSGPSGAKFGGARVLHADPVVLAVPHFLSDDECDRYVALSRDADDRGGGEEGQGERSCRSVRVSSKTLGKDSAAQAQRTSTTWFHRYEDVPALMAKASALFGLTKDNGEEAAACRHPPSTPPPRRRPRWLDPRGFADPLPWHSYVFGWRLVLLLSSFLSFFLSTFSTFSTFSLPLVFVSSSALLFLPVHQLELSQWEEPQTVRYRGGEKFGWHLDALPPDTPAQQGGQRTATVVCYLRDMEDGAGGATAFRDLGKGKGQPLAVKPTKGTAVVFFPSAGGLPGCPFDIRTLHAGQPVAADAGQDKWIAQLWLRQSVYTPTAPPGSTHAAAAHAVAQYAQAKAADGAAWNLP